MSGLTDTPMTRAEVLDEAREVITGARQEDYGDARGSFPRVAPSPAPRTTHAARLGEGYQGKPTPAPIEDANIISSNASDGSGKHYPVLDLDFPVTLVPSSTPGHFHLYLDRPVDEGSYWKLCDALAEAGLLEPGYVSACKERGYTSVRLPWVKKGGTQ